MKAEPLLQLPRSARAKLFVAGLMLGLFAALQLFAASSSLHCWLHPDSASPDHQCVVRIVANGDLDHAPTATDALAPHDVSGIVVVLDSFILVTVDYLLLPGRAPPRFFA